MSELIGKTIGEIQLIEKIAESDQTLVIKGFQTKTNSYVTVTVLQPQVSPTWPPPTQIPSAQGATPVQQPSIQPPPVQQPTMQAPPAQQPAGETGSTSYPACCGSLGFVAGFVLPGGVFNLKYRIRPHPNNPGEAFLPVKIPNPNNQSW